MSGSPRESPTAYLQDRPVLSRPRAWALIVLGALVAASAAWVLSGQYWTDRLEGVTIDWRFQARGPRSSNAKIVIVEIDAESHRRLKHDGLAFNLREHFAPAISRLADAGALVVGLDTWLEDRTSPDIDGSLAAAIESTNVVLGTVYTEQGVNRASEELRAAMPVEGLISVELDAGDHVLRRTPPRLYLDLLSDDGSTVQARLPHFPLAVALFAILETDESAVIEFEGKDAKIGRHTLRAGELVDYVAVKRGMREGGFRWPALSLADVVEGKFDAKVVDGAIVLIGESRMVQDSFLTPLSKEITPGVYYHANVAAQILDDRHFDETWSVPANARWVAASCALMAGVFAMMPLARRWRGRRWRVELQNAVLGIAVFPGGWSLACFWAFDRGVVLPLAAPMAGMGVALAMGYAAQWIKVSIEARRLGERARHIERLFSLSVSSSVLEAIKSNPQRVAQTEVRDVTVLFCDLRDFTRVSSEMEPLDVAAMLNEYYSHVTAAVFEQDGFLDKFVGDAVMAVFSAPFEQLDHANRAIRTAKAVKSRLATLNAMRIRRGQQPLSCGFGIHTGPAALGHVGGAERSNYTVIGTTVNLASRIEGHSRDGEILISEAVLGCLNGEHETKLFGRVALRGASGLHSLHQIVFATDNRVGRDAAEHI